MGDRLDNLKHGECCDSVSNERAKYAPALQLLDHGQLHIGLHLQDGSYHTDRPMISGASRSPWLQKGATDGRSQAASWKIRLVRARRRMPRRPRRSTARCWGWKVQPFPMGDSTYEMIYAASGATRVIPPDALAPRGGWCWNELHTSDPKKALAFYEKVFGFAHRSLVGPDVTYHIISQGGVDRGGVTDVGGERPNWLPYVALDDADATLARARKLGGTICAGPEDSPNVGRRSAFCRIPPARRSRSSSRSQCRSSANQPATEALGSRGGARLEAQNARLPVKIGSTSVLLLRLALKRRPRWRGPATDHHDRRLEDGRGLGAGERHAHAGSPCGLRSRVCGGRARCAVACALSLDAGQGHQHPRASTSAVLARARGGVSHRGRRSGVRLLALRRRADCRLSART